MLGSAQMNCGFSLFLRREIAKYNSTIFNQAVSGGIGDKYVE